MRFNKALGRFFYFGNSVGIEEFTEVGFSEQLAELILVDGEGLGTTLGKRCVAVVDEVRYVAEQQR